MLGRQKKILIGSIDEILQESQHIVVIHMLSTILSTFFQKMIDKTTFCIYYSGVTKFTL